MSIFTDFTKGFIQSSNNTFDIRRNQRLEDRSYLVFEFPWQQDIKRYRIPFFENPIISEDNKARFVNYNPVSRPGSLFSYAGSESRSLKLEFKITMDHVRSLMPASLGRFATQTQIQNKAAEQKRFFDKLINPINQYSTGEISNSIIAEPPSVTGTQGLHEGILNFRNNIEAFDKLYQQFTADELINAKTNANAGQATILKQSGNLDSPYIKTVGTILFWINLIRSSVLNNAEDPVYGPPVIRLYHGAMYQGIPCICQSYSIDHEDEHGLEERTLIPRVMKIVMDLTEYRTGDFTKFEPNEIVKGDNVVGWEAVIGDYGTLDSRPLGIK